MPLNFPKIFMLKGHRLLSLSLLLVAGCQLLGCAQSSPVARSAASPSSALQETPTTTQGPMNSPAAESSEHSGNLSSQLVREPAVALDTLEPKPTIKVMSLKDDRLSNGQDFLPELSLRSIGMHIGGGENTPAEKRPWLEDLAQAESKLLACHLLTSQPLKGGVIGVEYYVGKAGGSAEIRSVRHKLGAEDYAQCLNEAFEFIQFHQPRQPTVVSCAFRFSWRDLPE